MQLLLQALNFLVVFMLFAGTYVFQVRGWSVLNHDHHVHALMNE